MNTYDVLNQIENSLLPDPEEQGTLDLNRLDPKQLIRRFSELYDKKGDYLSVLLGENGDPNFVWKMKNSIKPLVYEKFGIKADDTTFAYIFEYFFSSMIAVLSYWFQSNKNISLEELLNLLHALVTEGILKQFQQRYG